MAETEDTSIGLVVVSKPWDMNAVSVVNHANKFCDKLVLLYLPKEKLDEKVHPLLENFDVNAVFQPEGRENTPCRVEDTVHKIDVTLLLQTVLTIMPISVFLHESDIALRGCFSSILETFPRLFTLQTAHLSEDLLTINQRLLRGLAPEITKGAQKGKSIEEILRQKLPENSEIISVTYHHPVSMDILTVKEMPFTACVKIEVEKEIVSEVFEVKEKNWKFWEKP